MTTVDEHVENIIESGKPELRCRVERHVVDEVLHVLHHRIKNRPELANLLELQPYDFRGTNHLWNDDGIVDYALARKLCHFATQAIMQKHNWDFTAFVQNVTQKQFWKTPMNNWNTTANGLAGNVYQAHTEAILDLIQNDARYEEWRDVKWYDFKKASYTDDRARELTHVFVQKLMSDNKWDFPALIKNMRNPSFTEHIHGWQDAFKKLSINRYGTTLTGLIDRYDDSPADTILDLVKKHESYSHYRDLQPYDFPDQRNIWNLKNGKKNYELARMAIGTLIAKHELENEMLPELRKRIGNFEFQNKPINRYGTTLRGMLRLVYSDRVSIALHDWFNYGRKTKHLI